MQLPSGASIHFCLTESRFCTIHNSTTATPVLLVSKTSPITEKNVWHPYKKALHFNKSQWINTTLQYGYRFAEVHESLYLLLKSKVVEIWLDKQGIQRHKRLFFKENLVLVHRFGPGWNSSSSIGRTLKTFPSSWEVLCVQCQSTDVSILICQTMIRNVVNIIVNISILALLHASLSIKLKAQLFLRSLA